MNWMSLIVVTVRGGRQTGCVHMDRCACSVVCLLQLQLPLLAELQDRAAVRGEGDQREQRASERTEESSGMASEQQTAASALGKKKSSGFSVDGLNEKRL